MSYTLKTFLCASLAVVGAYSDSFAAGDSNSNSNGGVVIIKDSAGIVRANETVEDRGTVGFALLDSSGAPAEGVEVTIIMEGTGETLTAIAEAGYVAFEGILPGTWIVSSATPGITFTSISIGSTGSAIVAGGGGGGAAGVAIAPVAVGGAAVASAVGFAIATNDSNDEGDDPISKFR